MDSTKQSCENPVCQVCGMQLELADDADNVVGCASCFAPHHRDCWEYTGMCSTYGCGGIVNRQLELNDFTASKEVVTINDNTAVPSQLPTVVQSLWRRLKDVTTRSYHSIRAGSIGALIVAFGYFLLYGSRYSFWRIFPSICTGLGIAVIVYGFFSALLASLYHRYSLETSIMSAASFYLAFSLMDLSSGHWSSMLPQAMFAALSAMVFFQCYR